MIRSSRRPRVSSLVPWIGTRMPTEPNHHGNRRSGVEAEYPRYATADSAIAAITSTLNTADQDDVHLCR